MCLNHLRQNNKQVMSNKEENEKSAQQLPATETPPKPQITLLGSVATPVAKKSLETSFGLENPSTLGAEGYILSNVHFEREMKTALEKALATTVDTDDPSFSASAEITSLVARSQNLQPQSGRREPPNRNPGADPAEGSLAHLQRFGYIL